MDNTKGNVVPGVGIIVSTDGSYIGEWSTDTDWWEEHRPEVTKSGRFIVLSSNMMMDFSTIEALAVSAPTPMTVRPEVYESLKIGWLQDGVFFNDQEETNRNWHGFLRT